MYRCLMTVTLLLLMWSDAASRCLHASVSAEQRTRNVRGLHNNRTATMKLEVFHFIRLHRCYMGAS
jgi:hypothetical protein